LSAKIGPGASQQRVLLFNHLVGRSEQRRWDPKTERLGSFEIDGKLEFGWLLYRQITWLGALQNLVHGCGAAAERIRPIRSMNFRRLMAVRPTSASLAHKVAIVLALH
jgi:hypothetical protein